MNYKIKRILATILMIAITSVSIVGCGEASAVNPSTSVTPIVNTPIVVPTETPVITPVSSTPTTEPTVTPTTTVVVTVTPEPTNTPTPTIVPAEVSVIGDGIKIYLYKSFYDMYTAFGETGENDPEEVSNVVTKNDTLTAYLRMYVKNPNGNGPESFTSIAPDGTEVTVSNRILYRGEYELLLNVMEDYQWEANFFDENGEATELEFEWDIERQCFVIKLEEGQKATINVKAEMVLPSPTPTPTSTPIPSATATPTPTKAPTNTPTLAPITPVAYRVDNLNIGNRTLNDPLKGNVMYYFEGTWFNNPDYQIVYKYTDGIPVESYNAIGYYENGEPKYSLKQYMVFYYLKKGSTPLVYLTDGYVRVSGISHTDTRIYPDYGVIFTQLGGDDASLPEIKDNNGNRVYASHAESRLVTCTPIPTYTPIKVDILNTTTDNVVHQVMYTNDIPMNIHYLNYTDSLGNKLVRFCDAKGNILNDEYFMGYEEFRSSKNNSLYDIYMTAVSKQQYYIKIQIEYKQNIPIIRCIEEQNKTSEVCNGYVYSSDMWDLQSMKAIKPGCTKIWQYNKATDTSSFFKASYDEKTNRYILSYLNEQNKETIIK